MKNIFGQMISALIAAVLLGSCLDLNAQTYRILPLGNSITEGMDGVNPPESMRISYRKELSDQLQGGGYSFKYAGHRWSGYDLLSDAYHGGIPGTRAQYIARMLLDGYDERWGQQITPDGDPYLDWFTADIILLHIGTNDITHGEGSGTIDMVNILNRIDAWEVANGTPVVVFVAKIIQRTDNAADNATTIQLNNNVASLIASRGDPGIIMVDLESGAGINYNTEMLADGIHPTQSAYDKMGRQWYAALNSYLSAIPKTPANFVLGAETASSITLSWNNLSSNETGFEIERSSSPEANSFVLIHTSGPGTTSYTDGGLNENTMYYYRIRAINSTGPSLFTNIEGSSTVVYSLETPTQLVATPLDDASIHITWTDGSESETGFEIERSEQSGSGFTNIHTTPANETSYTDAGIRDGTRYYYRVRASDGANYSPYSNEVNAKTALSAPTSLSAATLNENAIGLSWSDNSSSETAFVIERSLNSGDNYMTIYTSTANVIVYTDNGLIDGQEYFYRVQAIQGDEYSDHSNEANAVTELKAPSDLSAAADSEHSIQMVWTDNSASETGYHIERSLSPGTGYLLIHTTPANTSFYTDAVPGDGVKYYYRVRATSGMGNSEYSNEVSATSILAQPTALVASPVDDASIQMVWTDNSVSETGFKIERSENAGFDFTQIYTTTANETVYSDLGLADGKAYTYRVRASNGFINSAYSNEAIAATVLSAPTALSAIGLDESTINLKWSDNSVSETGYLIERSEYSGELFTVINTTLADASSFSDNSFTYGKQYIYRVRATNGTDYSAYSNEAISAQNIILSDSLFSFYPNPSNGNFVMIVRRGDETDHTGFLMLADFSGKIHYAQEIDLSDGIPTKVLEIQLPESLPDGFYSLSFFLGARSSDEKFILIR